MVAALRQMYLWIGQSGDLTDLGVLFRARWRDSADFLGKLRTRSFQGLAYDSRGRVVANSADVGNGQRSNRIPMLVQDGITNIDDSLHLVAFPLFIASLLNGSKMRSQIARCLSFAAFAPSLYGTCPSFLCLVCQDNVACCSVHEIHNCTSLNIESRADGGIHLRDNHDLSPVEYAQMTGLTKFVSSLLHYRQSLHSHAFDRRMLECELEQV